MYFIVLVKLDPSPDWDTISPAAKDFISQLLKVDTDTRMTAGDALNHSWITGEAQGTKVDLSKRVGDNLVKHFNARKKLKVGMEAVKFISAVRRMSMVMNMNKSNDAGGLPALPSPESFQTPEKKET